MYVNVINRIRDGSECVYALNTSGKLEFQKELGRRSIDAFLLTLRIVICRFTPPRFNVTCPPTRKEISLLFPNNLPFLREEEHLNNLSAFLSYSPYHHPQINPENVRVIPTDYLPKRIPNESHIFTQFLFIIVARCADSIEEILKNSL